MAMHHNRVTWREGMFLRPQHFQQQQRHWDYQLQNRLRSLTSFHYGILQLQIDEQLLQAGHLALSQGRALFADGTFCHFPAVDLAPPSRHLSGETRPNQLIYLALASDAHPDSTRCEYQRHELRDDHEPNRPGTELEMAHLQPKILLEQDDRQGYLTLPVARLLGQQVDGALLLDPHFLPCAMAVAAMPPLQRALEEVVLLLTERANYLSRRLAAPQQQEIAEWHDLLLLQLLNRYQPLLAHLAQQPRVHPERLFSQLAQLAAELATFTSEQRRPAELMPYQHQAPQECFNALLAQIRLALGTVITPRAIPLPLQSQPYGLWSGSLHALESLTQVALVLAVKAQLPQEQLHRQFPQQSKVATPERIHELIALQLPGIPLQALPVVPRHLPYHAGFSYFQLDLQSPEWHGLSQGTQLALHVAGEFPALELQLWAIRS